MDTERLNHLTSRHTAFEDFSDMLAAHGGYFPSIGCLSHENEFTRGELTELADGYDEAMKQNGDKRRAFRW